MKKLSLIILTSIFAICTLQTKAQLKKGAFVSFNVGYNAAAAVSNPLNLTNTTQTGPSAYEETQINFSLGKGVNTGLNIGYMVNEHIGFELGVNYLIGAKTKSTEKYTNGDYSNNDVSSKMIQIKPTIILATSMKKFTPYAKFGITIGSGKITANNDTKNGSTTFSRTLLLNKGIGIGFNGAVGILFPINKNLSFSTELATTNMQYSPKKGLITKSSVNGVDNLAGFSVYNKETDYVKKITYNSGGSFPNSGVPRQELAIAMPFSSIGINIGLKYSF